MSGRPTRADGRCKRGHVVAGENAYEYVPGKFRCKQCHAEAAKKHYRDKQGVESGATLGKALIGMGLGLGWKDFEARCARSNDWGVYEALNKLLGMPLPLLGIDMKALQNYLDTAQANTEPGRNPLRDLNEWLAGYGKPKIEQPTNADEIAF